MLLDLAFAPWIYRIGGRVRWVPIWAGSGVVRAPWGPYTVSLSFSPRPGGSHTPGAGIEGSGWVCTPQGQRYSLRVTGGAAGRIWSNMEGHTLRISAYYKPFGWQVRREDYRPSLSFVGHWVGPNLEMNDDGSIAAAFNPDGTLKTYRESLHTNRKGLVLPIVLNDADWRALFASCPRIEGR
jgi:hypothetical protein